MLQDFPKPQALLISFFLYVALVPFTFLITMYIVDIYFPLEYCYALLFSDWFLTTLIYVISVIVGNCSLIDFYWTIWPLLQLYYTLSLKTLNQEFSLLNSYKLILASIVLSLWGVRLTFNYIRSWVGYRFVDFRIAELLEVLPKNKLIEWVILYFHYFIAPGLFLYFAKLPILSFILYSDPGRFTLVHVVGLIMMIFAICYQTVADKQLYLHRIGPNHKKILDSGVWYYSRHPNYFGEMTFWWGAYILSHELYIDTQEAAFYAIGPILMTVLFNFFTGPWMDKHMMRKRPEYKEHIKKNRSLVVPWFRSSEDKDNVKNE